MTHELPPSCQRTYSNLDKICAFIDGCSEILADYVCSVSTCNENQYSDNCCINLHAQAVALRAEGLLKFSRMLVEATEGKKLQKSVVYAPRAIVDPAKQEALDGLIALSDSDKDIKEAGWRNRSWRS